MKNAALLTALGLLVAGCGGSEDRWLTPIATATSAVPGQMTALATLNTPSDGCDPLPSPGVEVIQDGQLGTVLVQSGERLIDPTGEVCPEVLEPTTVVLYEATASAPGFDTVIFRELRPGTRADREHTVEIRVR